MDQLVQMMKERSLDIQILKEKQQKNTNNLVLLEKEKNRTQKQNWIIKVLKASKYMNVQLKTEIYLKTIQIMKNHIDMQNYILQKKQELEQGFTEKYINLFVYFYNNFDEASDKVFKNIVRPNNNHIIVDLIKSLVQIQKNAFKKLFSAQMNSNYKVQSKQKSQKLLKELPILIPKVDKRQQNLKIVKQQQQKKEQQITIHVHNKFRNFIRSINFQELQKKSNELFKTLKQGNQKNYAIIQRYRGNCLGQKTKIQYDYDISGLYTRQEIFKMARSIKKEQETLTIDISKQVNPQICPQQEVRQRIKMQFQLGQSQNYISVKKDSKIQKWLPLILSKTNLKTSPLELLILNNKSKLKFSQFRYQNTQQYLTQYLEFYISQNKVQFKNNKDQQHLFDSPVSLIKFNKKDYIDFNRRKQLQLLQGDPYVSRKDILLPELNNRERQFLQNLTPARHSLQKKIRSFSEKRLPQFESQSSKLQLISLATSLPRSIDMKFTNSTFSKSKSNDISSVNRKGQNDKYSLIYRQKVSISKLETDQQNSYRNRIKSLLQNSSNSSAYNILMRPYQPYQAYQGKCLKKKENVIYNNSFLYK